MGPRRCPQGPAAPWDGGSVPARGGGGDTLGSPPAQAMPRFHWNLCRASLLRSVDQNGTACGSLKPIPKAASALGTHYVPVILWCSSSTAALAPFTPNTREMGHLLPLFSRGKAAPQGLCGVGKDP